MNEESLQNFEKLLMFFYVLSNKPKDADEQLKRFRQISGLSEIETQMALDQLVLRGFADKR